MIEIIGPAAVGAVVGWMLYFFMRKYGRFSPKSLTATLPALAGGPVLTALERWTTGGDAKMGLWYFRGVGVGFFAYALYAGIVSALFAAGKIKSFQKYEAALGCGAGMLDDSKRVEGLVDLENLLVQ